MKDHIVKQILCLCLILLACLTHTAFAGDDTRDKAYTRIMAANTIRCGYYVWPPYMTKDPNSGKLGGFFYDVMTDVGQSLNLKIDWVSEINFDAMFEGYASGKYDMVCAPLAATPARARASDFTQPFMYAAYYLYARDGDTRFDGNYAKVNNKNVVYGSLDGDMNEVIGKEDFPEAKKFSMGQNAAMTDTLMAIKTKKADVSVLDPVAAINFIKANPKSIHQVKGGPVRVMPLTYSIPIGEEKLKAMLNITLQSMVDTGHIDTIVKKYPDLDATLLRMSKSYDIKK